MCVTKLSNTKKKRLETGIFIDIKYIAFLAKKNPESIRSLFTPSVCISYIKDKAAEWMYFYYGADHKIQAIELIFSSVESG